MNIRGEKMEEGKIEGEKEEEGAGECGGGRGGDKRVEGEKEEGAGE